MFVCMYVCMYSMYVSLSVCLRDNSITNDSKVFKLGTENNRRISDKCYDFGVKGQGHRVTKCKNVLKALEWPA